MQCLLVTVGAHRVRCWLHSVCREPGERQPAASQLARLSGTADGTPWICRQCVVKDEPSYCSASGSCCLLLSLLVLQEPHWSCDVLWSDGGGPADRALRRHVGRLVCQGEGLRGRAWVGQPSHTAVRGVSGALCACRPPTWGGELCACACCPYGAARCACLQQPHVGCCSCATALGHHLTAPAISAAAGAGGS